MSNTRLEKCLIISLACNVILILVALFLINKNQEYRKDYNYFETLSREHSMRIEEMKLFIERTYHEEILFKTVRDNLFKEEMFLQTASPQAILNKYSNNTHTLGGNE